MGIFKKAERRRAKLKLALQGPAGAGKTHSALLLASGLIDDPSEDTIAVLDSENGSAELESGKPGVPAFSVVPMSPPYSPEAYTEIIGAAVREGFKVLILDSISPEWSGAGGILEIVDALKSGSRNQMAAWKEATPRHQAFVDSMIQAPIHIIATMRSKADYAMDRDSAGKTKVAKVGLAPQQRDGIEFEFTLIGEIDVASHRAEFTKDRTSIFVGTVPQPITAETGRKIRDWLEAGTEAPAPTLVEPEPEPEAAPEAPAVPPIMLEEVEHRAYDKPDGSQGTAVIAKTSDGEMLVESVSVQALVHQHVGKAVIATVVPAPKKGKMPRLIGCELAPKQPAARKKRATKKKAAA